MSRRFGWAMLVAAGMVLGSALTSHERTGAAAEEPGANVVDQLNDIRTQVREINTLLHSGTVKVVVVLNPDSK